MVAGAGKFALILALFLVEHQIINRILARLYQRLPEQDTQWEIQRRIQKNIARIRIWMIPAAIVALNLARRPDLTFPPTTTLGWNNYAQLIGVLGWGALLLIEYLQARHWQRLYPRGKST